MSVLNGFLREYGSAHCRALLLLSVVTNLMVLAPSFHMLQVYDRVLATGSGGTLFYITLIAVFALCVYGVAEALRQRVAQRLSARYAVAVARKMFARLALLPQGSQEAGRYLRDYGTVRTFLSGKVLVSLFDLPFMPLFLTLLYFVHPTIGLLTLGGIAGMILIGYLNHSLTDATRSASRKADAEAMGFAQSSFSYAGDVRSLGLLPNLINIWGKKSAIALAASEDAGRVSANLYALGKTFRQILQILIMAWGAWLVISGDMSGGLIFMASMISGKALGPIEQLIGGWEQLTKGMDAYKAVEELTGRDKSLSKRQPLPTPVGHLRGEALALTADGTPDGKRLFANIFLDVRPGEMVALVGPSGSGKSALAKVLAGAVQPMAGRVTLDGAPQELFPIEQWGRAIGFVADEVTLFPGSIAANITRFDANSDPDAVYRAAKEAGAHDMILRLPKGYQTAVGEGSTLLSAGQKQQIALARAFYGQPKVLILDHPTAFLDQDGEGRLFNALTEARQRGAAILVVSRRNTILQVADRALVLQNGMIGPVDLGRRGTPPAQPVAAPTTAPSLEEMTAGAVAAESAGGA